MSTQTPDEIVWTGKNTGAVKSMVMTHVIHEVERLGLSHPRAQEGPMQIAYFIQRKGSHMTKVLWRNIVDDDDPAVTAAVWSSAEERYVGLKDGDTVRHTGHGQFEVVPC